ncbi:hypothetical protein BLOT_007526 [Blomia tropicalis]|nr:hypothetical protein BLOT_007526 [Blomia tropicalis]
MSKHLRPLSQCFTTFSDKSNFLKTNKLTLLQSMCTIKYILCADIISIESFSDYLNQLNKMGIIDFEKILINLLIYSSFDDVGQFTSTVSYLQTIYDIVKNVQFNSSNMDSFVLIIDMNQLKRIQYMLTEGSIKKHENYKINYLLFYLEDCILCPMKKLIRRLFTKAHIMLIISLKLSSNLDHLHSIDRNQLNYFARSLFILMNQMMTEIRNDDYTFKSRVFYGLLLCDFVWNEIDHKIDQLKQSLSIEGSICNEISLETKKIVQTIHEDVTQYYHQWKISEAYIPFQDLVLTLMQLVQLLRQKKDYEPNFVVLHLQVESNFLDY